jgi:hypothetical protein
MAPDSHAARYAARREMILLQLRRVVTNAFLVALLFLFVVDALPVEERYRAAVDPILDVSGLWQEQWRLFAPEVDKVNTRVSAEVLFADGATASWRSPDWPSLGVWQRFTKFRQMEYFDSVRLDENRGAWPPLARYLAKTVPHPNGATSPVIEVVLSRHWATIPAPGSGPPLPAGPYVIFNEAATFYTWRPTQ